MNQPIDSFMWVEKLFSKKLFDSLGDRLYMAWIPPDGTPVLKNFKAMPGSKLEDFGSFFVPAENLAMPMPPLKSPVYG